MKFTKEDFTEDELALLRMAFGLLDTAVRNMYKLNWSDFESEAYYLKQKLGIDDLVEI